MSGVADFLFGGSDNSGQSAQIQANKDALKLQAGLANQARGDVTKLFPLSDVNRNVGYQSALDMIAAGTPNQINAFQQGNVGAQNALIGGQQQFQNAIMGNPIDMGQAQQLNVDTSYLNQQLPSFLGVGNVSDIQNLLENPQSMAEYLAGYGGAQSQNPPSSAAQYMGAGQWEGGNTADVGGSMGSNQGAGQAPDISDMSLSDMQAEQASLNSAISKGLGFALPGPLGLMAKGYMMSRNADLQAGIDAASSADPGANPGPGTGGPSASSPAGGAQAAGGHAPGTGEAGTPGQGGPSPSSPAGGAQAAAGYSGGPGYSGGSGGGDGGDGGDGTVICTELHRQGLMSDEVYKLDAIFGDTLPQELIDGYHAWAVPWVGVMRKSKMATSITNVFAKPWSKYMANKVDPTIKGSAFGAVVHHVGGMFCMLVGKIKSQNAERLA